VKPLVVKRPGSGRCHPVMLVGVAVPVFSSYPFSWTGFAEEKSRFLFRSAWGWAFFGCRRARRGPAPGNTSAGSAASHANSRKRDWPAVRSGPCRRHLGQLPAAPVRLECQLQRQREAGLPFDRISSMTRRL